MELFEFKEWLGEFGLEWFNKYYASYQGFVHSNEDPDNLGRLQLTIKAIYGDKPYKYWALPKGLYSGDGVGSFFIPSKGDKVWISFENGDPRYPIWEYGGWAKGQTPDGAKPEVKMIKTVSGNTIELNDKDGEERVFITDKSGNKYTMNKDGIVLEDKHGHKLVMKQGFVSFVRNGDKISMGADGGSAEPAVLGDKNADVLKTLAGGVQDIITAIQSAGVAPMDGGATFKAALIAALTQTYIDMVKVNSLDADQTKSQQVTLD